jgi:hypothetical protein
MIDTKIRLTYNSSRKFHDRLQGPLAEETTMSPSQSLHSQRWHSALRYSLLLCLLQLLGMVSGLQARPCFPSDPEGENPGNLCLTYPTHGMTLHSSSFRQGFASDGYYGTPTGPRSPGEPIEPKHQPKTPLDRKQGYWTQMNATSGESRVQTSTGKSWLLRLKN